MVTMLYIVGVKTQAKSAHMLPVAMNVVSLAATCRLIGISSSSAALQSFSNVGSL